MTITERLRNATHITGTRRWQRAGGQAFCTCGHEFKRRRSRAKAVEDADLHALDMIALGAQTHRSA